MKYNYLELAEVLKEKRQEKGYSTRELGEIVGGATPSTKCEDYYGGSIPWITPKDLSSFKGRYITSGERNITEKGLASCSAQMMPKDAVLFTSRAPIGYVAIASQSVCTNQGFKSIVVNEKADPLFVYYLLKFNKDAIEAGISVYNRSKGKPIVNSADAAGRIEYVDLAAANDAIVIALCNGNGVASDNDERMGYMQTLMERGMMAGMDIENDMWFDPLFLVIKGMQDKQMDVLEFIKMISDMGMKSTGGLSNNSNGMPKHIRPIMDSVMVSMAMMQGLTSAIVNPNDLRLMEAIKSADVIKNNTLYADSYLEI